MEGGGGGKQKLDKNEVVVPILGGEEGLKTSEKSEDSRTLERCESGSYSFSKYLQVEPPIANLQELESLETQKKNTTMASPCSLEIKNLSPNFNKSSKVPPESVTQQRSKARSAYLKPKSRLAEPSYPSTWKFVEEGTRMEPTGSPYRPIIASPTTKRNATSPKEDARTTPITPKTPPPITPKTPLMTSFIEEEDDDDDGKDDDDVYQTGYLQVVDENKQVKKLKFMIITELIAFVCLMGFLIASLTIPKLKKYVIWRSRVWKWCVLVLVIFCGRLVTEWCSKIIVFLLERNYFMKKKVLYFVYSLKTCVRVLIWLGLILMAWELLINREARSRGTHRIMSYISRALASSLIGVAMWTLKTLFVKILASSFHVKTFFDKIQESIFNQYVIQTLSGPPLMECSQRANFNRISGRLSFRSVKKGKQLEKQEVIDVEKLYKMKREKVSAWTMGGLIQLIRTSGLYSISDALDQCADDEGAEQKEKKITNEWEAKATAYRIFKNVAKPGSKHIDEEDLLRFINTDEVDNVLPLFEGALRTGKIKKLSFCDWVVNVYNDRKYLAHSLNDTKTAIEELNKILSGVILVIIVVVWLLLMGIATTKVLVFISSQLLLVVFVFGSTCRAVFEGLVFVFVMHPFDVGDRCVIDGIQMVVEEMNILTTIFLKYDNEKIFYPNSDLAIKPISNFNRSPEMSDLVEFAVDVSTSAESILALKANIKAYLESRPQYWNLNHSLHVKEIEDANKMKMVLYVTHTINFQNYEEKSNRRSELVLELKKIFEELGIQYHLLPQEIHIGYGGSEASPRSSLF
ncbi:hypothetical protein LguiB_011908 [Lonicera macranthoides]